MYRLYFIFIINNLYCNIELFLIIDNFLKKYIEIQVKIKNIKNDRLTK